VARNTYAKELQNAIPNFFNGHIFNSFYDFTTLTTTTMFTEHFVGHSKFPLIQEGKLHSKHLTTSDFWLSPHRTTFLPVPDKHIKSKFRSGFKTLQQICFV